MPRILVAEIVQVGVYVAYGVVASVANCGLMLHFALGFVVATAIPSIILGYGFKGMKSAIPGGNSAYERFRATPIANGIWGLIHLALALSIYLEIHDGFRFGYNWETALPVLGFCSIYLMTSLSQRVVGGK